MKNLNIILCVFAMWLLMVSCKKDENNSSYPYAIRMTDIPGPYDAVYVELQGVEITGGGGVTVLTNVHTGIFNLLDYSNGIDTLIASGTLNDAKVSQIRLILGPNNSVRINNVSYPLSTPSADQTGLKLQVHQTLQAGVLYSVLFDFDANKSIIDLGNGTYKLKPVIRTIETAISGAIRGKISPAGISAFVTATSATNLTYSTNVNANGDFLLMGIPSGTYSVTVTPSLPLLPVTQPNISVTTGMTTDLSTFIIR
jgi:hypothetical protein